MDLTEAIALLLEHEEKIKKLERFVPVLNIPKTKRKKRSEDVKRYRKMIQNSYK